jgi:cytochrome oxidase Cu insertion factor (SCO1/SenC/PrrC family)
MSSGANNRKSRTQLVMIALVFLGPLAVAAWLYWQGGELAPSGRTNHGSLLEPIISLEAMYPDSAVSQDYEGTWLLVYPNQAECDDGCRDALYVSRQVRLMLGKEMDRVQRIFLHGESPPDTVFLAEEHPGLDTIQDSRLYELLDKKRPINIPAGGYFLIDPLGNLVMYFRPDLDPADMVDDIKRLLRLSRIG